jgi:Putative peptidoglycan binding domain
MTLTTPSPDFPNDQDWISDSELSEAASLATRNFFTVDAALNGASWAPDALSPDYKHLNVPISQQEFDFTAAHVAALCELNRFQIADAADEILFGLRGCVPANGMGNEFSASVRLREDVPDHRDFHCVLGVWKRSTSELAVFRGSTVPNRRLMKAQLDLGGQRCNMLPTGCYRYRVGIHRQQIVGVFRQEDEVVVRRTKEDLTYERTDFTEKHLPADNIHPALSDSDARFSSAGCMTVPGHYIANTANAQGHRGDWAIYRRRAGLSDDDDSRMGVRYIYVLLTGREARLVSQGNSPERLRIGSKGDDVSALQQSLIDSGFLQGQPDGDMGKNTVSALIHRQREQEAGAADGIAMAP